MGRIFSTESEFITFSEAVQLKLLTDYKVIVLAIDAKHVSARIQELLKDDNNQLNVDDAARIIGCWKALSKHGMASDLRLDPEPMKRAVAFCQVIERQSGATKHKVSSKQMAAMFQAVVDAYQAQEDSDVSLRCEADHVDGSMNAKEKERKLTWLKAEPPENTCRILSNVRCLSEGVDVPALDAVLFLSPRNSQVDVVQSVGRVMRRTADGKKQLGYVILPVVIPEGMEPHEALSDNKVYKVVWEVLQALRSHDDRFDAMINKLDLIGRDTRKMEVIAITDKIQRKAHRSDGDGPGLGYAKVAKSTFSIGSAKSTPDPVQRELQFNVGEIERALYAKIVQKCGNRRHWEEWANDIAKIAQTHITRISQIVSDPKNTQEVAAFTAFADELRDDLNDSITNAEVIEMLAQHLITKPVFEALFKDYSFASNNPASQAMQNVLDLLQAHRLDKEADTLEKFYASVAMRAEGIDKAEGKQKIVVELYDKFFRNAFPKMTERLGIVYTPVEVVDFIIHSINDLLQSEFGQTLGSKGVHILDPFTGTGTFITRLLQSGLIKPEELPHKYKHEIHANEIVLLAYYIAAINIEAVYHSLVGGKYEPFEGICLTDTFRLGEEDLISGMLANNSDRRKRQQKLEVRVIMGNPPYSVGQRNENDNNANVAYPLLDDRIEKTYGRTSTAVTTKSLYDSYIRAIRWASDRIGNSGIIGFVTNAGFLDGSTSDGLRKALASEFNRIYVFHLRGNQRTLGEISKKEGGKIFGSGSRSPIAITLLVRNPELKHQEGIMFHDIGDYLSREEKLERIASLGSINGIGSISGWTRIVPDEHGDWLRQRDDRFGAFLPLGDKKTNGKTIFNTFSQGVISSRDSWVFNFSREEVTRNMRRMIDVYNRETERFVLAHVGLTKQVKEEKVKDFVESDPRCISWSSSLIPKVVRGQKGFFESSKIRRSSYKSFTNTWMYFDEMFNHRIGKMSNIFPSEEASNRIIMIKLRWSGSGSLALILDHLPEFQTDGGTQCFPQYLYGIVNDHDDDGLFSQADEIDIDTYTRRDGITDAGLEHFQKAYPATGEGETITKEDLFYYIYGLLHSADYRLTYPPIFHASVC